MRIFLISTWLIGLHCGVAVGQGLGTTSRNSGDYDTADCTGIADADQRLKTGKAAFYIYGLRESGEFLDWKTGIPFEAIADCEADNAIVGRADGNNARINEFIAVHGLPSNSFKRWEKDLFDLWGFYEKQSEKQRPFRLTLRGPAAKSADGKYTMRLAKYQHKLLNGTPSEHLSIVISVAGVDHKEFGFFLDEAFDGFWGPAGSGFAVVRYDRVPAPFLIALDLERGEPLRSERLRAARP